MQEKDLEVINSTLDNALKMVNNTSEMLQKTIEKSEKQILWFKLVMFACFVLIAISIVASAVRDITIAGYYFNQTTEQSIKSEDNYIEQKFGNLKNIENHIRKEENSNDNNIWN